MDEFDLYWKTEVKPLAIKCTGGSELFGQLENAVTDIQRQSIIAKMWQYNKVDWFATYHINEMLSYFENNLDHERFPIAGINALESCFNSEDYYKVVFCDKDCDEQRNYRALGKKLTVAKKLWLKNHDI